MFILTFKSSSGAGVETSKASQARARTQARKGQTCPATGTSLQIAFVDREMEDFLPKVN